MSKFFEVFGIIAFSSTLVIIVLIAYASLTSFWDKVKNYRSAKRLEQERDEAEASREALLLKYQQLEVQIKELEAALKERIQ